MNNSSFLKLNLVPLGISFLLTFVFKQWIVKDIQFWAYLGILFYFGLNWVIYFVFIKNNKSSRAAVNNVMISSMIRLFSSIIVIIAYLLAVPVVSKATVIFFLFYYLLFMAFEIYFLVYKLRPQNKG
jgi:hypothetical protein